MDTEPRRTSAADRVRQILKEEKDRGELVETPFATFHFSYLSDARFQQSAVRDQILQLNLLEITIANAKRAIEELRIKSRNHFNRATLEIRTRIPQEEEKKALIIPSLGIGGKGKSGREMELYFDPDHPEVVNSLRTRASGVAHELNHVARWQSGKMGRTLLDGLMSEGLATYYQEHWTGEEKPTRWGNALTPEQEEEEWTKIQPLLSSREYNNGEWFFGKDGKHPVWTGYTLGTAVVRSYFKRHPGVTMRKVVRMDSREILRESNYMPPIILGDPSVST